MRIDRVIGLRRDNVGSGVGLFNHQLARRLDVQARLLSDHRPQHGDLPLYSLKFEELSDDDAAMLRRQLEIHGAGGYALFMHTAHDQVPGDDGLQRGGSKATLEGFAIDGARFVVCGNDAVRERVSRRPEAPALFDGHAPSLLPEGHRRRTQPGGPELLYFGMATKIDRERFEVLASQLEGTEFKLLCSLSVHQTSDGQCLSDGVRFFESLFGERFLFLGQLTDLALSYHLDRPNTLVGFYPGGVRANNTTFNTAWLYGKRIITNLDEHSPAVVRDSDRVLDLGQSDPTRLANFIQSADVTASPGDFTWDRLLEVLTRATHEAATGEREPSRHA